MLLILAGVSISMIAGENGIATKATASKTKTAEAGEEEAVSMAVSTAVLEGDGTIKTDESGNIVSEEVKKVLNNELKKIGYEGEEIIKLPTKVEMAYNTYLIDEFGKVSINETYTFKIADLKDYTEIPENIDEITGPGYVCKERGDGMTSICVVIPESFSTDFRKGNEYNPYEDPTLIWKISCSDPEYLDYMQLLEEARMG